MSEWISVEDQLPDESGYKLCIHEQNLPYIACYDIYMHQWHDMDLDECNTTHWMPLPSPPETE